MWTLVQYTNLKRRYKLCKFFKNEIGNEFHYLCSCFILITKENSALKEYFRNKPNTLKFKELMTYKQKCDLKNNVDFKTL